MAARSAKSGITAALARMQERHSTRSSRNNRGRTPSGAKFSSRHPRATEEPIPWRQFKVARLIARLSALQRPAQNVHWRGVPAGKRIAVLYREETGLMNALKQMSPPLLALLAALLTAAGSATAQSSFDLRSPDNRIEMRIRTVPAVRYDVLLRGRALLQDCTLALDNDHHMLGLDPKVHAARKRSYDQTVEPAVRQKFSRIRENYNELRLEMEGGYAVVFRAYNEGAAYRFETSF